MPTQAFISYRFTGETLADLEALLQPIQQSLRSRAIEPYCSLFDPELAHRPDELTPSDYLTKAFEKIDSSQLLFALVTSDRVSEGMLLEIGYGEAKRIPLVVAIKEGVSSTYLPRLAAKIITWTTPDDLLEKLATTDFNFN